MSDINLFVIVSNVMAGVVIVFGTMIPALSMGRVITGAMEALARQPEAEKSISRSLFVGLAMIESLAVYCLVVVLIIIFRNPLFEYLVK